MCSPKLCELPTMNKCQQKCINDASAPDGYTCACDEKFYELQTDGSCKPKAERCDCAAPSFCVSEESGCKCKGVNGSSYDATIDADGKVSCKIIG